MKKINLILLLVATLISCSDPLENAYNPETFSQDIFEIRKDNPTAADQIVDEVKINEYVGVSYNMILEGFNTRTQKVSGTLTEISELYEEVAKYNGLVAKSIGLKLTKAYLLNSYYKNKYGFVVEITNVTTKTIINHDSSGYATLNPDNPYDGESMIFDIKFDRLEPGESVTVREYGYVNKRFDPKKLRATHSGGYDDIKFEGEPRINQEWLYKDIEEISAAIKPEITLEVVKSLYAQDPLKFGEDKDGKPRYASPEEVFERYNKIN